MKASVTKTSKVNDVYVLNPNYGLRDDIYRFILFSKTNIRGVASPDWMSFIHPAHAAMLSFFTHKRSLAENWQLLARFFHCEVLKTEKLMLPFIENREAFFTTWNGREICFPKQLIIPIEKAGTEYHYKNLFPCNPTGTTVDTYTRRLYSGPLTLTLMLTNRCMTHCRYCYADTRTQVQSVLTTSRILELIREAATLPVQQINLIGGEIFLHKDWDIILTELVKCGIEPEFISTKMPFNAECLQKLKQTGYKNIIQVSLDAIDTMVLNQSLSVSKSYAKQMMQGLRMLDQSDLPYQVSSVLTTYNCNRQILSELFQFLSTLKNLQDWRLTPVSNSITTNYRSFAELKPSHQEISDIFRFLQESVALNAHFRIILNQGAIKKQYYSDEGGSMQFSGATCSALNNHLFILPDGKVTICEQLYWNSRFIIGDARESGLKDIWKSEKTLHLCNLSRNDIGNHSRCRTCICFEDCFKYGNRCWSDIIKAYGKECWDYPDPRCAFAPEMTNRLDY